MSRAAAVGASSAASFGQLFRFLAVGVCNTLLTLATIWALLQAGLSDTVANGLGYLVGLTFSFFANRSFTFKYDGAALPVALRFLTAFAGCWLLNLVVLQACLRAGLPPMLAHAIGMPVYTVAFFIASKKWVFRPAATAQAARAPVAAGGAERPAAGWDRAALGGLALVAAVAAIVCFARLGELPLEVWDEARQAVNAQEMARGGLSPVTTFDGQPERWNTKPPLAIWAMAASMEALGDTEFAARLPSALCALLTAVMVYAFVLRVGGSVPAAVAGALLLFASPGFVQYHAARAADFDAMLAMWTTSIVFAVFFGATATDPRTRDRWYALACTALIAGFMTKTIQSLLMGPALAAWIVLQGRFGWTLRSRSILLGVPAVVGLACGWYALREAVDPGYLQAALANDIVGRFGTVIEGHQGGPLKYLLDVKQFPWHLPALALGAFVWWRAPRGALRSALALLGLAAVCYLAVISSSQTKLPWYAVPVVPLSGAMVGLALSVLMPRLGPLSRPRVAGALLVVAAVLIAAWNVHKVGVRGAELRAGEDRYSEFVRGPFLAQPQTGSILIVHPGYKSGHADWYLGPMHFYLNRLREAGHTADALSRTEAAAVIDDYDTVVACGDLQTVVAQASRQRVEVRREGDCAAWR